MRCWADAAKVFAAFQEVMAGAPDEFSARIGMGRAGRPEGGSPDQRLER